MRAHVAQSVEHVLGKDGVTSSNLVVGSRKSIDGWARHLAGPQRPETREGGNDGQAEV